MTKYLITPTLINSYQYYINDEFKSPADSRTDFLKTLSREKFEANESIKKGIQLEDDIMRSTKGWDPMILGDEDYLKCVQAISNVLIPNCLWQQSVKKEIKVGNQEFLLYGRIDVIKKNTIYDIKYTSNYELGKFLDSSQHLIYLYCTGLPKFQYLISDGKDYWIEDYYNHANIENEIKSKISDLLGYLENDMEAKKLFETKWGAKND
jgi:hypothetical protein